MPYEHKHRGVHRERMRVEGKKNSDAARFFTCWRWPQAPQPWTAHEKNRVRYMRPNSTIDNKAHLNLGNVANHVKGGLRQIVVLS